MTKRYKLTVIFELEAENAAACAGAVRVALNALRADCDADASVDDYSVMRGSAVLNDLDTKARKKTLAILALGTLLLASTAFAQLPQLNVYDAHGKEVGRYEPTGVSLGGGYTFFGESAIMTLNDTLLAIPISPAGFSDTPEDFQSFFGGTVLFTGQNCNGTAYLIPGYDTYTGAPHMNVNRPIPPFIQDAIVINTIAYYVTQADFSQLVTDPPITVCSSKSQANLCGTFPNCFANGGMIRAEQFPLSSLKLTPPFSVR